jgi:type I restriction enzyme S subunit
MISTYKTFKKTPYKNLVSIPSHWAVVRLKYLVSCNDDVITVNENDDFEINYIEIGDVNIEKGIEKYSNININEAPSRARRKVETNDIIISTVRTYLKAIAKIPRHFNGFIASTGFVVLRSKKVNPDFLHYIVQNETFIEEIISMSVGASYPAISSSNLLSIAVPFPSTMEQTKIAQYLDHQTAIIDQLIQQKEKLIELLKEKRQAVINEAVTKGLDPNAKMKDSGIQGVEKIPNHWSVKRLKQIANAFGRIGYRGYTTSDIVSQGEGAITISPSNLKGDYMTFEDSTYITWEKYTESPEIQIFNNDVLMVKTGSTYGKIGFVQNLNEKATINPQLLVFKKITISPEYLFNLLRTPLIKNQIETNVIGSTIPTMSQTKILNFKVVVPPYSEIEDILAYIKNSMINIDKLNSLILIQIEKLKEYRQSIISEAVTGKIDVRDWQPNKKQVV